MASLYRRYRWLQEKIISHIPRSNLTDDDGTEAYIPLVQGKTPDAAGAQPLRYQKQYYDKETGLHYSRYRYYNPHGDSFIRRNPADYPV